jgi:hypothetical protein
MTDETTNLPIVTQDGFDLVDPSERLIQGEILKCNDGHWFTRHGQDFEHGKPMLVVNMARALQHWQFEQPVATIVEKPGQPFPDADDLNAAIPRDQWENGLDGKPRPPWQLQYVVYLIDPIDGGMYTYLNSTKGARIAFDQLRSRMNNMRALSGKQLVPVVELDERRVSKEYNKIGPFFRPVRWLEFRGASTPAVPRLIEHGAASNQPGENTAPARSAPWDDDGIEPNVAARPLPRATTRS